MKFKHNSLFSLFLQISTNVPLKQTPAVSMRSAITPKAPSTAVARIGLQETTLSVILNILNDLIMSCSDHELFFVSINQSINHDVQIGMWKSNLLSVYSDSCPGRDKCFPHLSLPRYFQRPLVLTSSVSFISIDPQQCPSLD